MSLAILLRKITKLKVTTESNTAANLTFATTLCCKLVHKDERKITRVIMLRSKPNYSEDSVFARRYWRDSPSIETAPKRDCPSVKMYPEGTACLFKVYPGKTINFYDIFSLSLILN